ncbi:MAG: 50S ribosomal protein L21 [Pirellulaceae bacterium]|nr:50S ribosomal protein L21 [Pirellulaceae bacterium]
MYAIIADSGRQYKVEEGQELEVDYRDVPKGEELTFDKVLAVSGDDGLKLGKPTVEGATVTAEVLGPTKGEKIYVQKLRRRKNSRRRTGHRQIYTKVRISKIAAGVPAEVE